LGFQRFDGALWEEIRDLINHTQVFNPNKPVSVFFDVCTAIGQDSRGCGGLAWERARCAMLAVPMMMQLTLLPLVELCFMGYLADDRTLSPPAEVDNYP
jgi:hypothetical protein